MIQKNPRIELPKLLKFAQGQNCVNCGRDDGTTVAAHYQGLRGNALGRGGSAKAHDFLTAHLCDRCHSQFDDYGTATGSDDRFDRKIDHSEQFLYLIAKSLERAFRAGVIK